MELIKVNHAITAINEMLENLVDTEVISGADRANLLPVVLELSMKNETIDLDLS